MLRDRSRVRRFEPMRSVHMLSAAMEPRATMIASPLPPRPCPGCGVGTLVIHRAGHAAICAGNPSCGFFVANELQYVEVVAPDPSDPTLPWPCPRCGVGVLTLYRVTFGPIIGRSRSEDCRFRSRRLPDGAVIAPNPRYPNLPTEAGREDPCPRCGSESVARIFYGYPDMSDDLRARISAGEVVAGGCMRRAGDGSLVCNACMHRW